MNTIDKYFKKLKETPSDINEHLETLYQIAKECKHITEFGTRHGVSTTAFLAAKPEKLICYDIDKKDEVELLKIMNGYEGRDTEFVFMKQSTLETEIEETEILFIDTLHTYKQVKAELEKHADKAKKYIIFHDTVTFGYKDEIEDQEIIQKRGINAAIREFLDSKTEWKIVKHFTNNNGLTIIERSR